MYIDLLSSKKNIVKVSYADTLDSNMSRDDYCLKTKANITSWTITAAPGSSVYLTVICCEPCYFTSLGFGVVNNTVYDRLRIEYSHDYINWEELPYKSQYVDNQLRVYRFMENHPTSGNLYVNIDNPKEVVQNSADLSYAFIHTNPHTRIDELLYTDNLLFSFMRFTFEFTEESKPSAGTPLQLSRLEIMLNETFNSTYTQKNVLSAKIIEYFRSKIFETKTFMPDQVFQCLRMWERNNTENYVGDTQVTFLQNSRLSIEDLTANTYETYPGLPPIAPVPGRVPEGGSVAAIGDEVYGRDLEADV